MKRIEVGQFLKTNYGTGPYKVIDILRDCTCDEPVAWDEHIALPPHLHMVCRTMTEDHNKGSMAWLGFYDETTLQSVLPNSKDKLILLANAALVQSTLAI